MLPGHNTNITYKGKMYHVQTEDSGISRPQIVTLVFLGGNIIASRKTGYADIVNSEFMKEVVKDIIDEQHAQMINSLKSGDFDEVGSSSPDKNVDSAVLNVNSHGRK